MKEIAAAAFDERVTAELASRRDVLVLVEPLPSLKEAKQKVASGKADFTDRMILLAHFAAIQQWKRVDEQLAEAAKLAAGKPGVRWVSDTVLLMSRKHEELKKRLGEEAARIAKPAEYERPADALPWQGNSCRTPRNSCRPKRC